MYHRFGHMQKEPYVKKGEKVKKGQHIGYVGNTGNSSAPHVHYDIFIKKPKSTGFYSLGLTVSEVANTWANPAPYVSKEHGIPAPYTHEGYTYLEWTGRLFHTGTDINHGSAWSDEGNPIKSPVDGIVYHVGYTSGWGWMVIIEEIMQTNPNLIKAKNEPEIYYYNDELKFHIPDWETFEALKYTMDEVTEVDTTKHIPSGQPFPSVAKGALPMTFNRKMSHETQGQYPICIAMSMTRLFELQYEVRKGKKIDLSVKASYIDAGGQGSGTLSATHAYRNLAGHKDKEGKGFLLERDCPTGDLTQYDPNWINTWRTDVANADGDRVVPSGYTVLASRVVDTDEEMLKRAIFNNGGWTVSVDTRIKGWDDGQYNGENFSQNHMVVITGWDENNWLGYNHWHEGNSEIKLNKKMPIMWARQFII